MGHIAGHGRSGSLTKSFKAAVKKSKSGIKYTSTSAGGTKSQTKAGITAVKKKLGITEMKHGPMSFLQNKKGTKDVLALKLSKTKGGTSMFGSEASQATNEYLVSIGEAKKGNPYYDHKGNITGYSYFLTSKGKEMKYGKSEGAMGSGDPSGIMSSVPISEAMFEKQKKIQTLALAGMSLAMPMGGGQLLRAAAADTFQRPYSDYISTFYKGQSGEANFAKAKEFANQSKETANLAMGDTFVAGEKKSKKLTKDTTKYFAGSYADESKKKRKFFQHGAN